MKPNEVKVIAEAMLEKKGQGVLSLNLKKIGTAISDYFVVCNADSTTNVLAIADNVEDRMIERCKRKVIRSKTPCGSSSTTATSWCMSFRPHTGSSIE